jgi:prevent-host-death family protein
MSTINGGIYTVTGRLSIDENINHSERVHHIDKRATCSYIIWMDKVKSVGIRKLKNSLSAYLREVKKGAVILVTEHGNIVAELRIPVKEYSQIKSEVLRQEWVDSNKLYLPAEERKKIDISPVTLPAGSAARILDLERRDKR